MTDPRAICATICDRLKWHYAHRTPLPNGKPLTLNQLQRLTHAVAGEFI